MKKFAIFSTHRTGSTLFCQQLNSFASCICHYELFNPDFIGFGGVHNTGLKTDDVRARDANLEKFYSQIFEPQPGITAIGFKIFADHSPHAILHSLSDTQLIKIILKRDLLTSYVSLLQAQVAKVWISTAENEINKKTYTQPVYISLSHFEKYCGMILYFYDFIKKYCESTSQELIQLTYHDIITGNKFDTIKEILKINGEQNTSLIKLKKQGKNKLRSRIINFDEVLYYCKQEYPDSLILYEE